MKKSVMRYADPARVLPARRAEAGPAGGSVNRRARPPGFDGVLDVRESRLELLGSGVAPGAPVGRPVPAPGGPADVFRYGRYPLRCPSSREGGTRGLREDESLKSWGRGDQTIDDYDYDYDYDAAGAFTLRTDREGSDRGVRAYLVRRCPKPGTGAPPRARKPGGLHATPHERVLRRPSGPTTTRPTASVRIFPAAPLLLAGPGYLRLARSGAGEVHP